MSTDPFNVYFWLRNIYAFAKKTLSHYVCPYKKKGDYDIKMHR